MLREIGNLKEKLSRGDIDRGTFEDQVRDKAKVFPLNVRKTLCLADYVCGNRGNCVHSNRRTERETTYRTIFSDWPIANRKQIHQSIT